ncbi:hypothetical protein BFJ66_g15152 [Fusarium oxysporum f. sp. cepae]|uniref:JmjC domain-containing protein n=1 Tax=Fusarium oxysporum f. sp. cepae TaxID=396571 RepID=A0A3L6N2D2_FUSOX|nr:hypothetical protein BFJ65_g14959 [Fusarium oxysporum f. sp. cepae]RKK31520.1 hypothetical protein BFJ67_g15189 [Fusarium oxysporum f. sp. cepae]RKK32937.1 hypothetical protein BFJ66_g15152 [Fusarium oxysporum f. sp. cepae]
MDAYVEWVKKVLEEEIEKVETKISTLDPATREFKDSTESLAYLRSVQPGKPITKDQYMRKEYGESLDEFIFCSLDEAIEILTNGPCLLPMVIPAPPITEEDYYHFILERAELEKQIAQLPSVDVYDSGKKSPERIPEKWSGQEAMLRFYSDDLPSINMLNIRIEIKTGNSRWMAKIPGYDIIPRVVEQAEREGVDLTGFKESMEVTLAASQGADTMAHVDHEGVATSIDMWMGLKIWMLSYDFSGKKLKDFAGNRRCPPLIALLLGERYKLYQPPSTVHAVHTCETSIAVCDMYLDSRTTPSTLEHILLETSNDAITNDDHHKDLVPVLDRILAFWMTDSKMKNTERCPDDKHLSGAKKNLMVCYDITFESMADAPL